MATSKFLPHEGGKRKIRVAIIGAGLSGLTVANGLMRDPAGRFDVQVFERDTATFGSERGGYQLRISRNGLDALKTVSDAELWAAIREVWTEDHERAPTVVDPVRFDAALRLDTHKWYPKSRSLSRIGLRRALLQPMIVQGRVQFNHYFKRFDILSNEGGVQLHFDGQDPQDADILIAADGSGSQVNRQVGLNNKVKLQSQMLFQSRGRVSKSAWAELPESLTKYGPVLFLGGKNAFGYASIYNDHDASTDGQPSWTLYWSILVARTPGEELIVKAGSDRQKIIPNLVDYVRNELGYGEPMERILKTATEYVRTGIVTSSVKPETDWRNGDKKNARVIILGDAMHPMPPSRGMGANQAITDAGNLVDYFRQTTFKQDVPSDDELAALVHVFDEEMYKRTFNMVKTSEDVTALDLKTVKGRMIIAFVSMVMTAVGWVCAGLEAVGLRSPQKLDYFSLEK
ncbi:hypothetical protein J4E86_011391 [Alternaria arbusti]|uniref:uncharacterized protein n=1 Tax=Alternaria arbusti TaxID=232088 RepID=UPI0022205DF8|nr:uncharacterized protein J4E86_011391 [Alternaria arbusti]KAI4934949.1 hypothetical protein J4E86_011391 [Alternaria arbusti]